MIDVVELYRIRLMWREAMIECLDEDRAFFVFPWTLRGFA